MKSSDRIILMTLAVVALVAGFWFLVLSPKRAQVSELDEQITAAETAASEQEQLAATAEAAQDDYSSAYQDLVVLGKAVPSDSDQASLVEQVNRQAVNAGVTFDALVMASDGGGAAPAPAATPTEPAPAEGETVEATPSGTTTTPAPATEAAAATLPVGATVGPAGLPVIPYDLTFGGQFFNIADFLSGLDSLVKTKGEGGLGVRGRLLTVDGFSISPDETDGFPELDANLRVTSFVTPADQGVTGGATPEAPAPSTSVATTTETAPPVAATPAPTP